MFGLPVSDIVAGSDPKDPAKSQGSSIRYKDKLYTVHTASIPSENGEPVSVYFLVDDTTLKNICSSIKNPVLRWELW